MPIGFKNGTGGSIKIAVDGIKAASQPHHFLSVTKQGVSGIVKTRGNKSCHIILRGSSNGPNCDSDSINETSRLLKDNDLPGQLMVDCSHGNSNKDFRRQSEVLRDVASQLKGGSKNVMGVMIESHLVEGNQKLNSDLSKLTYGQSVTDACINFSTTEVLLEELAESVKYN